MPQIPVEDKVVNVDEYDAVKIDLDMAAKVSVVVGVLSLAYGIYADNVDLVYLSCIAIGTFVVSVFFLRSARVSVRRHGAWKDVGKYRYSVARYLKQKLVKEMT